MKNGWNFCAACSYILIVSDVITVVNSITITNMKMQVIQIADYYRFVGNFANVSWP